MALSKSPQNSDIAFSSYELTTEQKSCGKDCNVVEPRNCACDLCEKQFSNRTDLTKHRLFHTETKQSACEICGVCFSPDRRLNTHKHVHTGETPYSCSVCNKPFTRTFSCFLWLSLSGHYRVTDEALLAETTHLFSYEFFHCS